MCWQRLPWTACESTQKVQTLSLEQARNTRASFEQTDCVSWEWALASVFWLLTWLLPISGRKFIWSWFHPAVQSDVMVIGTIGLPHYWCRSFNQELLAMPVSQDTWSPFVFMFPSMILQIPQNCFAVYCDETQHVPLCSVRFFMKMSLSRSWIKRRGNVNTNKLQQNVFLWLTHVEWEWALCNRCACGDFQWS